MTLNTNAVKWNASIPSGASINASCHFGMPEDERPDGDTSEYIPWDFDNDTYSEADVADLLDDEE